jgi:hypothetical protein
MAFVVDLDRETDRLLSAHLALQSSHITKAEFTAKLVRFAIDAQPETRWLRAALSPPAPAAVEAKEPIIA